MYHIDFFAEAAGACAVMALERIPADIRAAGGVSRMSDPKMIKGIQEAVSIPVMAKCRIGHFAEAQVLQAIEIDYIDESEVLSPADDVYHINKREFDVPFVCGAKDLGEALRRAGMILLASDIAEQDETYFETIPMTVKRNAYGRQLGSFHTNAEAAGIGEIPMTFIRAPFVESVHADASGNTPEILSIVEDRIVGVKYKNQMAFAFHPELDQDTRIHDAFLGMIR